MDSVMTELLAAVSPIRKIMCRVLNISPKDDNQVDVKPYLEDYMISSMLDPVDTSPLHASEIEAAVVTLKLVSTMGLDDPLECLLLAVVLMYASEDVAVEILRRLVRVPTSVVSQREYKYVILAKIAASYCWLGLKCRDAVVTRLVEKAWEEPRLGDRLGKVLLLRTTALITGRDQGHRLIIYRRQTEIIGTDPLLVRLSHRVLDVGMMIGVSYREEIAIEAAPFDDDLHCARFVYAYSRAALNSCTPKAHHSLLVVFQSAALYLAKVLRPVDRFDDINDVLTALVEEGASTQTLLSFVNTAYAKHKHLWERYVSCFHSNIGLFVRYLQATHSYLQHRDSPKEPELATGLLNACFAVVLQLTADQATAAALDMILRTVTFPSWATAGDDLRCMLFRQLRLVYISLQSSEIVCQLHHRAVPLRTNAMLVGQHLLKCDKREEADLHLQWMVTTRLLTCDDMVEYATAVYHAIPLAGMMLHWGRDTEAALHKYLNLHYDLHLEMIHRGHLSPGRPDQVASLCYELAGGLESRGYLQLALEVLHQTPADCTPAMSLTKELAIINLGMRTGHPMVRRLSYVIDRLEKLPTLAHIDLLETAVFRFVRAILDESCYVRLSESEEDPDQTLYQQVPEEHYHDMLQHSTTLMKRLIEIQREASCPCPLTQSSYLELLGEVYSRLGLWPESVAACSEADDLWKQWFNAL
jgi:hypothetical protein